MATISAVRDRAGTQNNGVDSPVNVNMPTSVEAGDRLIMVFAVEGTRTVTASGWTTIANDGNPTLAVLWKVADGTEGGGTVSVAYGGTASDSMAYTYAVDVAGTPEAAITTGSSSFPDAPSLSPSGGSAEYLWFAAFVQFGGVDIRDWPDDFGGWASGVSTGNEITFGVAAQSSTAATLDPTSFSTSSAIGWTAAVAAVPVTVDVGNFPLIEGVAESTWGSSASSQTLTLPADIEAGELLLAEIGTTGSTTPAITGWTTLVGPESAAGAETGAVLYKEADGTEGASETVTLGTNAIGAASCRRISNVDFTKLEGDIKNESGTSVTPPMLTPAAGSDEILWVVGQTGDTNLSFYRTTVGTPVPWPFNYSLGPVWVRVDSGMYSGGYAFEGASVTPTQYPIDSIRRTISWTVAVYPGAAPPPPPSGGGNRMGTDRAIRKPPRTPR